MNFSGKILFLFALSCLVLGGCRSDRSASTFRDTPTKPDSHETCTVADTWDGIEVRVTVPAEAVMTSRAWIKIEVINHTDIPLAVQRREPAGDVSLVLENSNGNAVPWSDRGLAYFIASPSGPSDWIKLGKGEEYSKYIDVIELFSPKESGPYTLGVSRLIIRPSGFKWVGLTLPIYLRFADR